MCNLRLHNTLETWETDRQRSTVQRHPFSSRRKRLPGTQKEGCVFATRIHKRAIRFARKSVRAHCL